jgi:aerobic carbon-monoxide dehydrogenase small subunit
VMSDSWSVRMRVNGQDIEVDVSPLMSLVEVLREHLGLRGTKIGCNKGECGACTVLMNGQAVNACLILAPQAEGADIWTIEGISAKGELHPLQEAFLSEGAVQCGYCTPGMIMSGIALLRKTTQPTESDITHAMAGNLCRCTGYQKIVRAIQRCAADLVREGRSA